MFLEVRILKNLAKNELEMKTKRGASEASTRYYLSTIVAQIIGLSMPGLSDVGDLTQSGTFQNGTCTHGADDQAQLRPYNRGHFATLQPQGAMNCAPTRDRMWMEDGYTRAHGQQNWI